MDTRDSAFARAPVALVALDRDGAVRTMNALAEDTLGSPLGALVQRPLIRIVHREDREALSSAIDCARTDGSAPAITLRTRNGERWIRWQLNSTAAGEELLCAAVDVTDLMEVAAQLEDLVDELVASSQAALDAQSAHLEGIRAEAEYRASHDELTAVLSRRAWFEHGHHAPPAAVAVIDIDHFKRVNDTHGHIAGDVALREVAWRIGAIVGDWGKIGRLGGEEFGVLFHGERAAAERLLERVVTAVAENPIEVTPGVVCTLTVSAGLAIAAEPGVAVDAIQDLYALADAGLYRAKRGGRNRLVVCEGAAA